MADTGARRAERQDFHDNDPFAELTRIMGHDPRRVEDPSGERDEEFGVDLEQELLGGLDLGEAETGQAERPADESEPVSAAQNTGFDQPDAEFPADVPSDDATWSTLDRHGEELFADQAFADDFVEDLDAAISADLAGQMEGAASEPDAWQAPATAVSDQEAPCGHDDDSGQPDGQAPSVVAFSPAPSSEEVMPGDELPSGELEHVDAAHWQAFPADHAGQASEGGEAVSDAEWRLGSIDDGMPVAPTPVDSFVEDVPAAADSAQGETFAAHSEDDKSSEVSFTDPVEFEQAQPEPAGGHSGLEDELAALLADGRQPDESHDSLTHAQPELPETVLDSDGAAQTREAVQGAAEQQAYDPFAALADLGVARDQHQDTAAPSQELRSPDADSRAPEIETIDIDEAQPPQLGDLQVPDLPKEEPVVPASELDDLEAELDRAFDFMNSRNHADEPLADRPADLGQDRHEQRAPQEWAGTDGHPYGDEHRWADTALYASGAAAHGTTTAERVADESGGYDHFEAEQYHAPADGAAVSAVPPPPLAARAGSRRKGLLIAAAIVAVALIGGISVFFLSPGGPGGGEPVLLRADADPVRVRPEDPGGTVVPNQDSQVYERVAGGGDDAEPTQQQLVDTTEEPLDLDEQAAVSTVPGLSDDEGGVDAAGEATGEPSIATVKAEDRVEQDSEAIASVSDDFVAVQPRRVRTMIVRPDGTMVPREEAAAANTTQPEPTGTTQPATGSGVSSLPSLGGEQMEVALAPVAQTEEAATVSGQAPTESAAAPEARAEEAQAADTTPPVEGAPRSRPADAAPATEAASAASASGTATQQEAPQQEQQVAAVAPTPAPAPTSTASGEWSMQIASQPSADSAQVTYQDLARRYSSLLEGRGVNIVRAEIEGRGTYYRVRIPMDTRDEAINLCTRYKAAGGSCFVSR